MWFRLQLEHDDQKTERFHFPLVAGVYSVHRLCVRVIELKDLHSELRKLFVIEFRSECAIVVVSLTLDKTRCYIPRRDDPWRLRVICERCSSE